MTRGQLALRCGPHVFGIRSPRLREYYSERNRLGWKVVPLRGGWRLFYKAVRDA